MTSSKWAIWPLRHVASLAVASLVALVMTGLVGCAGSPSADKGTRARPQISVAETLAAAPAWVIEGCRAYWQDADRRREVVCGVGSAPAHRNRVAARETAITRARSAIARSLEVTIESLVRIEERGAGEADLQAIVHQLSSTSLRGAQLEDTWRAASGEVHALVSLDLMRVQDTVRSNHALSPAAREELAERAADAFAEPDAASGDDEVPSHPPTRP
jgi:hypothetical protein